MERKIQGKGTGRRDRGVGRWQRQGDRVGEMTLEEARWAQEGTERREKAGSGGIKAREREQGGRGET